MDPSDRAIGGRITLASFAFSFAVLLLALGIHFWKDIPIQYLTRDPAATTGEGFFLGALSNYGVVLWSMALGGILTSLLALWKTAPRRVIWLLASGGALTFILLVDDLYLLHDQVFPGYLGIPDELLIYVEGVLFLAILVLGRKEVRGLALVPLVLAILGFGLSLGIDRFPEHHLGSYHHLFEDGGKIFGITGWLAFWISSAVILVKRHLSSSEVRTD